MGRSVLYEGYILYFMNWMTSSLLFAITFLYHVAARKFSLFLIVGTFANFSNMVFGILGAPKMYLSVLVWMSSHFLMVESLAAIRAVFPCSKSCLM